MPPTVREPEQFEAATDEESRRQPFVVPVVEELGQLSQITQQIYIPP